MPRDVAGILKSLTVEIAGLAPHVQGPVETYRMIADRYTIFTRIPVYEDDSGRLFADSLWVHDLSAHLSYISDLRICCPVIRVDEPPPNCQPILKLLRDRLIPLKREHGWISVAKNVIPNFIQAIKACRSTQIAHSGGAGWPFPLSYYLLAVRPILRFKWFMVIESSFWMIPAGSKPTLRQRLSHHVNGLLVRCCLKAADARLFTQEWYRRKLCPSSKRTLVSPAIWINESDVLSDSDFKAAISQRIGPIKILFAARLIPPKGVGTILDAVRLLEETASSRPNLKLDIIGSGPLLNECRLLAIEMPSIVRVLEPVPYGPDFFKILRRYDAVLLANRQAEQPRLIADAFSQGVPCIASRTVGIESMVSEGETGILFDVDDAVSLAACLGKAANDPSHLRAMSRKALLAGRGKTHESMHSIRHRFLVETLGLETATMDKEGRSTV